MKKKKIISTDDLAIMIQKEFSDMRADVSDMRTDISDVRNDMSTKKDLKDFREEANRRFDSIESKYISGQQREIDKLRDDVIQLKVKFAKLEK